MLASRPQVALIQASFWSEGIWKEISSYETANNEVCGLSWVTVSWYLEKDTAVEFDKKKKLFDLAI